MKIIIIHHLELYWEHGLKKAGTSFEEMAEEVKKHLESEQYDHVILTRFEDNTIGDEHHDSELANLIDSVYQYGYGWEFKMVEDGSLSEDQKWVEGGYHSEIVLIDDWMEELQGHEVFLCGAFDGECIEDMEYALQGAGVSFNKIYSLIV